MGMANKPLNPSHYQPASATTALAQLKRIRFLSAHEAIEQLANLVNTGQILWLYRKYFPREYSRSSASAEIPVSRDGESGYSAKEQEFMMLVDRHLFPLPDLFFEDGRFNMIPIYPQGVDYEDAESLKLPIRAAMMLFMDEPSPDWEAWLPPNLRPRRGALDWRKFERRCRQAGGLKAHLPLLIRFVSHDTGNLWFDADQEIEIDDFAWREEDIRYLAKEWRQAQKFIQKLDVLIQRMERHPRYWLAQLVRFWNACVKTERITV